MELPGGRTVMYRQMYEVMKGRNVGQQCWSPHGNMVDVLVGKYVVLLIDVVCGQLARLNVCSQAMLLWYNIIMPMHFGSLPII